MGLVNRVLSDAMFDHYLEDYLTRIRSNAPLTLAAIKASTLAFHQEPEKRDMAKLDQMIQDCFESEDYKEGQRAFMEKQSPRFVGR